MQLTPLQLEIQKLWADKSLSFGCLVRDKATEIIWTVYNMNTLKSNEHLILCARYKALSNKWWYTDTRTFITTSWLIEIIWKPVDYSRLCYLWNMVDHYTITLDKSFSKISSWFEHNPELYNKSILERPEGLQLLVRDFLLSIQD